MPKINIFIFIILFIILFIFILAFRVDGTQKSGFCLKKSYELYKNNFMSQDGRIIDYDKKDITTSEGQSYIMLRSLIMDDRETFDLTYKWAKNNLQRADKLFAWLWGEDSNGKYGILDYNSASDADVDIAFALLLAREKFDCTEYLQEAIPIINSIWYKETKKIGEHIVLMPGAMQTLEAKIEINPSYFSPYEFRFFQKYDELHDWNCLIDSSYYYLDAVMSKTQTHLPPNWFLIKNGQIVLENSTKSDFSYDAIRVFPRIYLDYIRTDEKRALPILEKSKFFVDKWEANNGTFYTNYKENGELRDKVQFEGSIGVLLPAISLYNKKIAQDIYKNKLESIFLNEDFWEGKNDYYNKNLLWFGCYLYNKNSNEYKKMSKLRIRDY